MAKAKKGAAGRHVGKRVQVIPLAALLDQPPLWWRLRMGAQAHVLYQTWTGWFPTKKEATVAAVCILLQTCLLGLVLLFDWYADYPSLREWEKIGVALFVSLGLPLIPTSHLGIIRTQWGKTPAPVARLYFLLHAFWLLILVLPF